MSRLPPEADPSFLGRLAAAGKNEGLDPPTVPELDADRMTALIVRNLGFVLNSRKRFDCVRRDFGLGDYADPRHIDVTIRALVSEIRDAVTRFEPRLQGPNVLALSRDERRNIQIAITGTVMGEPRKLAVQFNTSTRRAAVRED